jgi:hypothetical protein
MMVVLMMWALFVGLAIVVALFYDENPAAKPGPTRQPFIPG